MPNLFKHNATGTESDSLFKGDWAINLKEHGGGPTGTTGFYNGVDIPAGGYAIYGPGNHVRIANDDTELLFLVGKLGGDNSNINAALIWASNTPEVAIVDGIYENIVTDGLVLNIDAAFIPSYPRNGSSTYDVSINANNGTLQNGVSYNTSPNSFMFDGTDDRIEIPNNSTLQTTGEMSVNIWLKGNPTQDGGGYCGIFDKNAGSNFGDWACCGDSSNTYFRFGFNNTSNQNKTYQVPSQYNDLKVANWVNYQCTYDFQYVRIYRNSVLVVQAEETSTPSTETFPVYLGYRGYNSYFTGEIAVAQLYNGKVLSDSEVLQNFEAQKTRFGL